MTNIANIATQQVKTAPGTGTGSTSALTGGGTGLFGAGGIGNGMNFMDMIFARSLVTTGENAMQTPVLKAPVSVHPSFTANTQALSAAQIAMTTTRAVAAGISNSDISLIASDLTASGIDPAALQDILVQLSAENIGTAIVAPMEQSGETAAGLVTTAQPPLPLSPEQTREVLKVLHSLLQSLPAQNQPQVSADPALIATPLTPAELTAIIDGLSGKGDVTAESLIVGLVRILPPAVKAAITVTPQIDTTAQDNEITGAESALGAAMIVTPPLTTRLNTLNPATDTEGDVTAPLLSVPTAAPNAAAPSSAPVFTPTVTPGGYVPNAAVNDAAPQGNTNNNAAGGSSIAAAGMNTPADSLLNSAGWDSIYPDGLEWTQGTHTGTPGLSVTGTAQFASLVANAHSATAPHPATQVVAAQITKVAAEGENKSMTLKLDPPELGRIEIRMDFGKEKGMKAHLVIEKQETFLMLQRDAHVLERALQDAGINSDGDGNGLSFELAQDNLFNDGHNGSNRHGGGSQGSADAQAEDIIETTMNWYVDADTGMTHYDILA